MIPRLYSKSDLDEELADLWREIFTRFDGELGGVLAGRIAQAAIDGIETLRPAIHSVILPSVLP